MNPGPVTVRQGRWTVASTAINKHSLIILNFHNNFVCGPTLPGSFTEAAALCSSAISENRPGRRCDRRVASGAALGRGSLTECEGYLFILHIYFLMHISMCNVIYSIFKYIIFRFFRKGKCYHIIFFSFCFLHGQQSTPPKLNRNNSKQQQPQNSFSPRTHRVPSPSPTLNKCTVP